MPHPGTHIAVVQLLASGDDPKSQAIAKLFGHADVNATSSNLTDVARNRYACLGAVGPDLFYFLLDGSEEDAELQEVAIRFYARLHELTRIADSADLAAGKVEEVAGMIPCGSALANVVFTEVHEAMQAIKLGLGIVGSLVADGFLAATGFNAFSYLPSPRQAGEPRTKWFWADYLHYVKSGEFTRNLLDLALLDPKYNGTPELAAYAGGYFTHYVADTIGHPYVNQIVGGPYRLHRQRHTLVENFIDSVVWSNSFVEGPLNGEEKNPATNDPWIDRVRTKATPADAPRAAFHRSRVNLMIDVAGPKGTMGLDEQIDAYLDKAAGDIANGIDATFSTSALEFMSEETFALWSEMLIEAMRKTYEGHSHPMGLGGDGFPEPKHVNLAYVTCYAFMKMSTGSSIEKPELPDLTGMLDAAKEFFDKLVDKVGDALDTLLSAPSFPSGGSFSLKSLWNALKDWAKKVVAAAIAIVEAVLEIIDSLCSFFGEVASFTLKLGMYATRVALWAAYSALHRMLELRAYAQPFPETAADLPQLWQSPGNPGRGAAMVGSFGPAYPVMELLDDEGRIAQDQKWSGLEPAVHPIAMTPVRIERPPLADVGVNTPESGNPLFDLFWGAAGPEPGNDIFADQPGPSDDGQDAVLRDFGGIVPNCRRGLAKILETAAAPGASTCLAADMKLPNYNLDGDRGGGWVAWDLSPEGTALRPPGNAAAQIKAVAWEDQ